MSPLRGGGEQCGPLRACDPERIPRQAPPSPGIRVTVRSYRAPGCRVRRFIRPRGSPASGSCSSRACAIPLRSLAAVPFSRAICGWSGLVSRSDPAMIRASRTVALRRHSLAPRSRREATCPEITAAARRQRQRMPAPRPVPGVPGARTRPVTGKAACNQGCSRCSLCSRSERSVRRLSRVCDVGRCLSPRGGCGVRPVFPVFPPRQGMPADWSGPLLWTPGACGLLCPASVCSRCSRIMRPRAPGQRHPVGEPETPRPRHMARPPATDRGEGAAPVATAHGCGERPARHPARPTGTAERGRQASGRTDEGERPAGEHHGRRALSGAPRADGLGRGAITLP